MFVFPMTHCTLSDTRQCNPSRLRRRCVSVRWRVPASPFSVLGQGRGGKPASISPSMYLPFAINRRITCIARWDSNSSTSNWNSTQVASPGRFAPGTHLPPPSLYLTLCFPLLTAHTARRPSSHTCTNTHTSGVHRLQLQGGGVTTLACCHRLRFGLRR
jgi:hypothetical protein